MDEKYDNAGQREDDDNGIKIVNVNIPGVDEAFSVEVEIKDGRVVEIYHIHYAGEIGEMLCVVDLTCRTYERLIDLINHNIKL